jgi:hypothetical protein
MSLACTLHHWATYLPLPEPAVHSKSSRKRERGTQQVSLRRMYQGSRLPRKAARARYIRMHTSYRRHRQHTRYIRPRTSLPSQYLPSCRHQQWYTHQQREPHLIVPHTRPREAPPNIPTIRRTHACASLTASDDPIYTYDSDAKVILVDNCCTASITNDINDFVTTPKPMRTNVEGYNGMTTATKIGTIKWNIEDDLGRVHIIVLPNAYYSPAGKYKLVCPQHWAQAVDDHFPKPNGTWCATYADRIVLHWAQGQYTRTLRLMPATKVCILTTPTGITQYQRACHTMERLTRPVTLPTLIEPIDEGTGTENITEPSLPTLLQEPVRPVTPDPLPSNHQRAI